MFGDGNELAAYYIPREADMLFSFGSIDVSRSELGKGAPKRVGVPRLLENGDILGTPGVPKPLSSAICFSFIKDRVVGPSFDHGPLGLQWSVRDNGI